MQALLTHLLIPAMNVLADNVLVDDEDEIAGFSNPFPTGKVTKSFFENLQDQFLSSVRALDFWTVLGYTIVGCMLFLLYSYYVEYYITGKSMSDEVSKMLRDQHVKGKTPWDIVKGDTASTTDPDVQDNSSKARRKKVSARSKILQMSEEEKKKFRGEK
eukprot:CFRG5876T1